MCEVGTVSTYILHWAVGGWDRGFPEMAARPSPSKCVSCTGLPPGPHPTLPSLAGSPIHACVCPQRSPWMWMQTGTVWWRRTTQERYRATRANGPGLGGEAPGGAEQSPGQVLRSAAVLPASTDSSPFTEKETEAQRRLPHSTPMAEPTEEPRASQPQLPSTFPSRFPVHRTGHPVRRAVGRRPATEEAFALMTRPSFSF